MVVTAGRMAGYVLAVIVTANYIMETEQQRAAEDGRES